MKIGSAVLELFCTQMDGVNLIGEFLRLLFANAPKNWVCSELNWFNTGLNNVVDAGACERYSGSITKI
jgi:hypothetical protein